VTHRKVLIVGASGVVGRAALEHFARLPGWVTLGASRRRPDTAAGTHVPLDLRDRDGCRRALQPHRGITHLVYCALFEKPGLIPGWFESDQMQTNRAMLENLLAAIDGAELEHLSLLQGTKAYGAHVHPMRIPGREREPRDDHQNFYWLQEDLLREHRARASWSFTIWRPPIVFGHALGAPMNPLAAIGSYAAIRRAEGRPLAWPGGCTGPLDGVDARLLAEAFNWAAEAPAARDQVFNLSNGDVFTWEKVWPTIAASMGMAVGEPEPQRLGESMPAKAAVWDRLVASHGLRVPGLMEYLGDSYVYADLLFNAGNDRPPPLTLLSTIKIRRAGFHACVDTEDMLADWLARLQELRILPPA
jgi:nucleoside-diphosphate-sugar epimerase